MNITADVTPDTAPTDVPETDASPDATETPELSVEEQALAAMDEGIAVETPETVETVETTDEAPLPGTPEALAAETAVADAAKDAPEPDKETETEITSLGLKEKAAERFRGMAGDIKAFAPLKAELEKAGIKDAAEFAAQMPVLVQRSNDYAELIGMVQETGATPDQYGYTLEYLKDATAAIGGDLAAAQRAFDKASAEQKAWATLLGREVPGVHDPLGSHADLQTDVESGDITRARAMEIAQQRTTLAVNQTTRQRQTEMQQHDTDVSNGTAGLNQLGATLSASDPDYARKQPFLLPTLRVITQTMPPSQWVAAAQNAYAQIPAMPAPVAAAPAKTVPVGPVRAGSHRPSLTVTTDDPMEAMNQGIAAASM